MKSLVNHWRKDIVYNKASISNHIKRPLRSWEVNTPYKKGLNNYQKTPYEILKYYNRLLIFHGTGSGKTCTSINICEKMKNDYEKLPLIILGGPKLTHNYRKELKSECVGKKYN